MIPSRMWSEWQKLTETACHLQDVRHNASRLCWRSVRYNRRYLYVVWSSERAKQLLPTLVMHFMIYMCTVMTVFMAKTSRFKVLEYGNTYMHQWATSSLAPVMVVCSAPNYYPNKSCINEGPYVWEVLSFLRLTLRGLQMDGKTFNWITFWNLRQSTI